MQATHEGEIIDDDTIEIEESSDPNKNFSVDYCKRGSTKCKVCKKKISKDELRIGKSVPFKTIKIVQYSHLKCAFEAFRRARVSTNVITCMDDITDFDLIKDEDKVRVINLIDQTNEARERPLSEPVRRFKKPVEIQEAPNVRLKRLKSSNLPSLKLMYTNADQLTPTKKTELVKRIEREEPLIVAVCEAKPKNARDRSLKDYEIPNFTLHPVNLEDLNGRGIAVYTHESIGKSTIQVIPNSSFQEVCLLEIRLRSGDLLLFGCLYRSPTTTDNSAANNTSLNQLLKFISLKKYTHVCLLGDFNYKAINWTSWTSTCGEESAENQFLEACRDCFLHQHVERPTRRRGDDEPSKLDLIFTNEEMQVSEVKHSSPLGKSDHDVLSFEFQCYVDYSKAKERYLFSNGDYRGMRSSLTNSNWIEEYTNLANDPEKNPEVLWKSLKTKVLELRNQFVPLGRATDKPKWKTKGSIPVGKEVREAIKDKEKSHRTWMRANKRGSNDALRHKYTQARNKVNNLLRKEKRRFERDIALKAKSNPKAFWTHARRYLKTKSGIAPLLEDPKNTESMKFNDAEKSEILLKQFSSVFTQEKDGEIPRITTRTQKKVSVLQITVEMVLKELKSLNQYKSCGPDQLHPRLLIELAELLALPITLLFNMTFQQGVLPHDWRRAFISPIYKKGSRHLPENYRPISLTAILCKIMERFVRDKLVTHLLDEKLLSKKQYGFISGRSTTTQLLYYLDECTKITAKGGVLDSIYLDFSKAFDTVPHRRLLGKLEAYGVQGNLLNWIRAFLSNRSQEVVVNGSKSSPSPVISGIPQGTVLGPVLFVIYINDLLDNISSGGLMFADDTKIYRQITTRDDALQLQSDINKLEEWSKLWQLHFNHDKCHVLTMGRFDNIQYAHRYVVYDNEIEHVFDEKDLGVTIDSELKFEEHIARKVRIANAIVGQMRRSFSYLDCDTFKRIFVAFVRPHLEYGEAVWSPHLARNIDALENVQIRATKLVDGLSKLEYPERLERLNLPTLIFRRRRGDIIEMYKHFHTYDKSTLAPSFQPRVRLSRQHRFQLHVPPTKDGTNGAQSNFFFQRTAKVWNTLPRYVVEAKDVNEFKKRLDEFWSNDSMKYNHKTTDT